ncbi:hypothetical protein DAEQUDRAFT_409834 [Daedalea quercina L-15889]|uniref:RNI-like protein n=1 Tax=Daedalea quercina L-15889 TaxID=1314783 RepID=A0A165NKF5_9APHY|nr:hypothetical protein DAEQUDRAFT_409834 [Daedalea quercina L-15889]
MTSTGRCADCMQISFFCWHNSVTELSLFNCRFRSGSDVRRLTNALPSLTKLDLRGGGCPLWGVGSAEWLGSRKQPALETLALDLCRPSEVDKYLPSHNNTVLATCARYTTLKELRLDDVCSLNSLEDMVHFTTNSVLHLQPSLVVTASAFRGYEICGRAPETSPTHSDCLVSRRAVRIASYRAQT